MLLYPRVRKREPKEKVRHKIRIELCGFLKLDRLSSLWLELVRCLVLGGSLTRSEGGVQVGLAAVLASK